MKCKVKFTPRFRNEQQLDTDLVYDVSYTVVGGDDVEYDVEYNKIVYAYNGQVKVTSLPQTRRIKYKLGTISKETRSNPLSSITQEVILNNLGQLLEDDVAPIFRSINNGLGSSPEVVGYITEYNTCEEGEDKIWPLDKPKPSSRIPSGSKLVYKDYGNVILDGNRYDVAYTEEDNKPYLKKHFGRGTFGIQDFGQFGKKTKYIVVYTGNDSQSSIDNMLYLDPSSAK